MTDKQLELAERELRAKGYGWIDGKYHKPPKKYAMLQKEFSCIRMINSLLAYGCHGMTSAEEVMQYEECSYYNYLADYVGELGRDKVIALIQGQIDSIDCVKHCVYTDSEGCSYNSIVWRES